MPEKFVAPDLDALAALVRDARVGHFAFVEDGQPRVLPTAIVADGAHILLHGSSGSHWLRLLATGDSMIQIIDGVLARRLERRRATRVRSDARISTGLSKTAVLIGWPRSIS